MSWYRRSSLQERLQWNDSRRRQSRDFPSTRRHSLSSRIKYTSKTTPARESVDDDVELCNPPLDDVEKVKGYEDVTFEPMTVAPPADPEESPEPDDRAKQCIPPNIPQLTEEEVREALMQHTVTRCTYVRSVAREMIVSRMENCPGYQYTLESFTELRQVAWSFEPYTGGIVDDSSEECAPAPWEIRSYCPSYFQNHVVTMEVPHTASVKTCHTCGGIGRRRCSACSATGSENCYYCHGDGHKTSLQGHRERCYYCQGTGRKKCWKCGGDGMAACRSCGGTGQVKYFIALTVTWTNHVEEHVEDEPTEIGDRMENATGHIVMEEERHKVFPIENFPEGRMADVSAKLLEKHRLAFSNEKLLMQRHRVRTIPVAAVSYHWQSHIGCYYVYGLEKKVYAPDYPQACCCAIL